jgi:hypothetical protein
MDCDRILRDGAIACLILIVLILTALLATMFVAVILGF